MSHANRSFIVQSSAMEANGFSPIRQDEDMELIGRIGNGHQYRSNDEGLVMVWRQEDVWKQRHDLIATNQMELSNSQPCVIPVFSGGESQSFTVIDWLHSRGEII